MAKSETSVLVDFSNYNTLVFDCDGVILDSNKIKTQAFYEIALPYGEDAANRLVDYHTQNGGISRFKKFEFFLSTILGKTNFESELKSSAEEYGRLVKEKLVKCNLIPGFLNFIKQPEIQQKEKIVITGGFQPEVQEVFEERKLIQYFKEIFGSPDSKYVILERELKKKTVSLPAVYFGDSKLDYEVAATFGMDFVFLNSRTEFVGWKQYFSGKNVQIIGDWNDLRSNLVSG